MWTRSLRPGDTGEGGARAGLDARGREPEHLSTMIALPRTGNTYRNRMSQLQVCLVSVSLHLAESPVL